MGKGYAGLKAFLYLMNHPPPMSEKSYRDTNKKICDSVQTIADKSMVAAAKEVSGIEGSYSNIGRFSSLNGAVAGISLVNGKVLDVAIMSRHCQGCVSINTSSVTNDELLRLRAEHDCTISHIGPAPAMEAKGAELIFKVTQPLQNDKNCQKYDFPDFCLILIFNQRTTFCEILGVKILAEML